MRKWRWLSLPLALVMVVGLSALVGAAPAGGPAAGSNTVVIYTQQEPSCLQPLPDSCQMFVGTMVYVNFLRDGVLYDQNWKYFADIMEGLPNLKDGSWKVLPNGQMEVTWKIKKGYTWHDGKPVTAQDWIWAWRVNLNPDFPTAGRDVAQRVLNILAPNAYTLVVKWKSKYAFANHSVAGSSIMPKHATERQFRANPSKFDQGAWGNGVPTVGNGPYVLKEWQKGSSITLEAYPKWIGEKPAVQRIVFRFISDTNTLIANVLSGAADATDETAIPFVQGLELEQRVQREGRKDIILEAKPGLVWEHIDLNVDNEHLKDKRVRQALLYAINRDELVQQLFQGKQPVSHSWLPEKHYAYNKNIKKYAFDQARARALLAEAGYTAGSDGVLQKGGRRLAFTFMTTAGNRTRESVQQILQTQWKAVGVQVTISNQPARVYFGDTLPSRKFEMAMYAWVFGPEADCEGLYTGDTLPPDGQNYPGYKNDEVTKICHAVPAELDEAARVKMLARMQEIFMEDVPVIPLYLRSDYVSHKPGLQKFLPTSAGMPITWNSPQWRWTR
ncbi:MAG TPA: peptide ABC transporter substrate-binding protein [bacterium]|nr:peptide ABC transporter substrate-binding protein [bacterium]